MRLLKCELDNFGSYQRLEFNYEGQGLTLIHGATGSGKSTLLDAACWILFGVTAKNGSVNDVRRWDSGPMPTVGVLTLELTARTITITRIRGPQNDLFITINGGPIIRGKDLVDTQKAINDVLGFDVDFYLTSGYYSEFSPSSYFFMASAKDRRLLMERIANLEFCKTIAVKAVDNKKAVTKELQKLNEAAAILSGRLSEIDNIYNDTKNRGDEWEAKRTHDVSDLLAKATTFDDNKKNTLKSLLLRIEVLSKTLSDIADKRLKIKEKCGECGRLYNNKQLDDSYTMAVEARRKIEKDYDSYETLQNTYKNQSDQLSKVKNPFISQLVSVEDNKKDITNKISVNILQVDKANRQLVLIETLTDIVASLRANLLLNAVDQLQQETNRLLTKYFESEFRVSFSLEDSDKLVIEINKGTNMCSYSQLSKGQRGLLKLCFGVSLMKIASQKQGVTFSQIFLDEALDGLDVDLKVRSYDLFSELSLNHESVFVIEHSSEFKEMFDNRYQAVLTDDMSKLTNEK